MTLEYMTALQPTWLTELKSASALAWQDLGFPTRKQEDWKYTSTDLLAKKTFQCAPKNLGFDPVEFRSPRLNNTIELLLQDGHYRQAESNALPEGVLLLPFAEAVRHDFPWLKQMLTAGIDEKTNGFIAQNTAHIALGMVLYVPKGVAITSPIHFVCSHTCDNQAMHVRNLIVLEPGARCDVIETYQSTGASFTNSITEVALADSACLTHYKCIQESHAAYHFGLLRAKLKQNSQFNSHSFACKGHWVRSDTQIDLCEKNARSALNGLYYVDGSEHLDHHTQISHLVPECQSQQEYRGIITGSGHAVFNGKVCVAKGASQSCAKQLNKNLLLSPTAMIDTKPQLEILNEDVQCAHGATIGQLNEDALFYLQTRGIPQHEAEKILLQAFMDSLITEVTHPELQQHLRVALQKEVKLENAEVACLM